MGTTVAVLNDMRDLGAHFNSTSQRRYGTTLTTRMRKAAAATKRLGRTRTTYKSEAMIIRTKMLPKALYGCELAPVNESALRGLRREFVDAIAYTTAKRSVDLTFNVASYGPDLDPDVQISIRRAQAY